MAMQRHRRGGRSQGRNKKRPRLDLNVMVPPPAQPSSEPFLLNWCCRVWGESFTNLCVTQERAGIFLNALDLHIILHKIS